MKTKIEEGSENVFEDLGFDDPEEMERKSAVLRLINYYLDKSGLSDERIARAAPFLGWQLKEVRCGRTLSTMKMDCFAEFLKQAVWVCDCYGPKEKNHER